MLMLLRVPQEWDEVFSVRRSWIRLLCWGLLVWLLECTIEISPMMGKMLGWVHSEPWISMWAQLSWSACQHSCIYTIRSVPALARWGGEQTFTCACLLGQLSFILNAMAARGKASSLTPMPLWPALPHFPSMRRGWLSHTAPVVPVLPQPQHQDQVSCAAHARGRTGSPTFMQCVPALPSPYHLWYHHDVVAYWGWSQLRAARCMYRSQTFS